MIFQDGSCSEWYPTKANFVNFFRCYAPSQGPAQRKRRDMLCKAVSNPSMTHAQPDCPGLHGLPTIAKEITEGLTLDWTHGRNMKELIVLNELQWISMIYDWLILAACFCLLLLHANVQHLRAQKYGSSQKSHSYRLVSPASRNRDNASIWTDPWHEQGMYEYNTRPHYNIYTPDIAPMIPIGTQNWQKPDIE